MSTLIRRENRTTPATFTPAFEPFGLMRNLLRWDPFRELDYGFDVQSPFTPSFDIRETPEAYVFEADMPGIKREDLDLNLTGNRTYSWRVRAFNTVGDYGAWSSVRTFKTRPAAVTRGSAPPS